MTPLPPRQLVESMHVFHSGHRVLQRLDLLVVEGLAQLGHLLFLFLLALDMVLVSIAHPVQLELEQC